MPPRPYPRRTPEPGRNADRDIEMRRVDQDLHLIIAHADQDARFLRGPLFMLRARTAVRRRYLELQASGTPLVNPYGVTAVGLVSGVLVLGVAAAVWGVEMVLPLAEAAAAELPVKFADQPAEETSEPISAYEEPPTEAVLDDQPRVYTPAAHARQDDTAEISVVASVKDGRLATEIVVPGVLELSIAADTDVDAAVCRLLGVGDDRPRHGAAPPSTGVATLSVLGLDVLGGSGTT
ncbi:hypothetical protein Cs7R123_64130 [Catellatospora sp. TT07R-123]|uniref:hypothetical protein n=1 Tax=Catellatospora sp. TT07R-123 TaxID=2733863 RepID=UPI001B14C6DE|nr:hypothetical protein [Catellatospora sp. TT07R-123]GHJ49071.1 hypothetical protein Cs7R123_64130 [Catellatospora sp. TT07R-123]